MKLITTIILILLTTSLSAKSNKSYGKKIKSKSKVADYLTAYNNQVQSMSDEISKSMMDNDPKLKECCGNFDFLECQKHKLRCFGEEHGKEIKCKAQLDELCNESLVKRITDQQKKDKQTNKESYIDDIIQAGTKECLKRYRRRFDPECFKKHLKDYNIK